MHTDFSANRREFLRMTGVSAAAIAAGYLPTRARAQARRPATLRRDRRTKVYIVSDIHIGDNSMTCWYQQRYHEPFLIRILDEVLARRDEVRELILLGDVMDFWTYPPEMQPPTFAQIAAANPNIFGKQGKLSEVLRALEGRVSVLQGNHDMGFTQADWDTIGPEGLHPRLIGDLYHPMGPQDTRLVVAHGHLYTMFNAPDASTAAAPLPVGHYVTRSVAHKVRTELAGTDRTAADLSDQGAPNGMDIARAFHGIIDDLPGAVGKDHDVVTLLLELARTTCGVPNDMPIILPNGTRSSLADAKGRYAGLWRRWTTLGGGGYSGDAFAMRALEADAESKYLGWFAHKLALERNSDLVVMGHTHTPLHGLLCEPSEGRALCNYLNTGFGCRSEPDSRNRSISFAVIDTDTLAAQTFRVARSGSGPSYTYAVEPDLVPADSIVYRPTMDYSTYVQVENTRAGVDLTLVASSAKVGSFVVPPPARIAPGRTASFWIQDELGARGSEGAVTYSDGKDSIKLSFECPSGILPNSAKAPRGVRILARSGKSKDYGRDRDIPRMGHPLFVKFVV